VEEGDIFESKTPGSPAYSSFSGILLALTEDKDIPNIPVHTHGHEYPTPPYENKPSVNIQTPPTVPEHRETPREFTKDRPNFIPVLPRNPFYPQIPPTKGSVPPIIPSVPAETKIQNPSTVLFPVISYIHAHILPHDIQGHNAPPPVLTITDKESGGETPHEHYNACGKLCSPNEKNYSAGLPTLENKYPRTWIGSVFSVGSPSGAANQKRTPSNLEEEQQKRPNFHNHPLLGTIRPGSLGNNYNIDNVYTVYEYTDQSKALGAYDMTSQAHPSSCGDLCFPSYEQRQLPVPSFFGAQHRQDLQNASIPSVDSMLFLNGSDVNETSNSYKNLYQKRSRTLDTEEGKEDMTVKTIYGMPIMDHTSAPVIRET
ncbi:hypothetical protein SK128_026858, partial [Halocaridina rubra]